MEDNATSQPDASTLATTNPEQFDQASQPFVGKWNQLVSTTNWEKGRIIFQWRDALIRAEAPTTKYSDEAWATRVGAVTGQHVGRLRRVYQRFGTVYDDYQDLFWSHFHAALDWDDAEMWLEGAVQNHWSVSQMRNQRWETLGQPESMKPDDKDIIASEKDEDFEPAANETPEKLLGKLEDIYSGPRPEGPDFGDADDPAAAPGDPSGAAIYSDGEDQAIDFVRPFANISELPEDLAEAFETFKLAILRHKLNEWQEISRDDVLAGLDALKELAVAPSADAPF